MCTVVCGDDIAEGGVLFLYKRGCKDVQGYHYLHHGKNREDQDWMRFYMAQVVVRDVVSVPPWYTTANSAASLSSGSLFPAFLKKVSCLHCALTQAPSPQR